MMKWCFVVLRMNSWLIVVDDVEKHVVDELVQWFCLLVIWWWKSLLMMNIYESLMKFWIWMNWCLIHEFWAFLFMCLCTWLVNIIWDEFWVWKEQNWSVWEKGFWNSKFFFSRLKSVRLSVRQTNLKRACPVQF